MSEIRLPRHPVVRAGYAARYDGKGEWDNPHPKGSVDALRWEIGLRIYEHNDPVLRDVAFDEARERDEDVDIVFEVMQCDISAQIDRLYVGVVAAAKAELAGRLDAAACADAIGVPLEKWPGNCFGVSCALVESGRLPGRAVYGHWLGRVVPGGLFSPGVNRHGWIELDDGVVIDPTRWVFERAAPYVHIGPPEDAYDRGGQQVRAATRMPPPPPGGDDPWRGSNRPVIFDEATAAFVGNLLGRFRPVERPTMREAAWLSNLPYGDLGDAAREIYAALAEAGHRAMIPCDHWEMAVEDWPDLADGPGAAADERGPGMR
jgi:hypothetical protein